MVMLVVLDVQHGCSPGVDPDTDSTGALAPGGLEERDLTGCYAMIAAFELRAHGIDCIVLPTKPSTVRERWRTHQADIYVACHVNAGKWKYGAAFYRKGNTSDLILAEAVAQELGKLPGLSSGRTFAAKPDLQPGEIPSPRNPTKHWTYEAYSCIAQAPGKAITFEPFFIDTPEHAAYRSVPGLRFVAKALVEGILNVPR